MDRPSRRPSFEALCDACAKANLEVLIPMNRYRMSIRIVPKGFPGRLVAEAELPSIDQLEVGAKQIHRALKRRGAFR